MVATAFSNKSDRMMRMRTPVRLLALLIGAGVWIGADMGAAAADAPVRLSPGDDVAEIVRRADEGTTFMFTPGLYREVMIAPRDGQRFIGEDGAVLSGARLVDGWRAKDGVFIARVPSPARAEYGYCQEDRPLCRELEDLFVDGTRLERVAKRSEVKAGTWHYDQRTVSVGEDYRGRTVEIGLTAHAFRAGGDNVHIENLTVQHYAPGAQAGAIHGRDAAGWQIIDVVARQNHGAGLDIGLSGKGAPFLVRGGAYIENGQMGIRSDGGRAVIEDTVIAGNNTAGYDWGWEAGATKFQNMTGLTVRGTCVYGNFGPGLWTDIDNAGVLMERNVLFDNWGDGIRHEISHDAVIRNNVAVRNGFGFDPWVWGAQIAVQNSAGVTVTGNHVENGPRGGNGLAVIHQDRHHWKASAVTVTGNTVVLFGDGVTGLAADTARDWFWEKAQNRSADNRYVIAAAGNRWHSPWGFTTLDKLQASGRETGSRMSVAPDRAPRLETDCDALRSALMLN